MTISIEAYRASIGSFAATACPLSTQGQGLSNASHKLICDLKEFLPTTNESAVYFVRLFGLLCLIMVLSCDFKISFLKFHQGHEKYGETAVVQCVCNSLLAIACSKVRKVYVWKCSDLYNILNLGHQLYKKLNKDSVLSAADI